MKAPHDPKLGIELAEIPAAAAAAIAGAANFGDLVRRLAKWLGVETRRGAAVRLWMLRDGQLEALVRYPAGVELPSVAASEVLRGTANGSVRIGRGAFVPLLLDEASVGILEIRPAGRLDPKLSESLGAVVGARVDTLLTAQRQRERLPNVPLAEDEHAIQEVIAAFAAQAKKLLDHDRLSIYLLSADGAALERFAVATSPIVPGESDVIPLEQVGLARVVRTNESLISGDFGVDDRILGLEDSLIARAGFHGIVSVPLRVGGKTFGILNFVSRIRNFYSDADLVVAQQIADEVSVFLQNLRLQSAMQAAVHREAVIQERNRVAREFHDTLAQALAQMASKATALRERLGDEGNSARELATALEELARGALDEARRSLQDLIPGKLEERSLAEVFEEELALVQREQGISTSLVISGAPEVLPMAVQVSALRIFTEALTNVKRHARASTMTVQIEADDGLQMTIRDNGCGMQHHADGEGGSRFGLESMRARARSVGGQVVASSSVGVGTEVFFYVPAQAEQRRLAPAQPREQARADGAITRVLVIDDHPIFLEGMRELLGATSGIRVIGQAATASQGISELKMKRPDVVLLDLDLPDASGVEVAERIAAESPSTIVIVISAFAQEENVAKALRAGARGYISKSVGPRTLAEAIQTVMNGGTVIASGVEPATWNVRERLTLRELGILKQIALGKTNAEIGRELHLADKTVERVVATIAGKLGAKNRAHAVAKGIVQRLVDCRDL